MVMNCAACTEKFTTANSCKGGKEVPFKRGMICICIHCGTILCIVSPAESVIADPDIHDIPQEAYDIACKIVYSG